MNTYRRKPDSLVYVELLDLSALWRWLRFAWSDERKFSSSARLFVFDITLAARLAVWLLRAFFRLCIDKLCFNNIDVRDIDGIPAYASSLYHDLRQFREFLLPKVNSQRFWREARSHGRMAVYLLKKTMCEYDFSGDGKYNQVWHVFMMLRVLEWHRRSLGQKDLWASLWIKSRPFMAELQQGAALYNVDLHTDRAYIPRKKFRIIGKLFRISPRAIWQIILFRLDLLVGAKLKAQMSSPAGMPAKACLLVDYSGNLNLDKPECFSDLFFLSSKGIMGKDVLMRFRDSIDPLDQAKLDQLEKYGIQASAYYPQATLVGQKIVPVFVPPIPDRSAMLIDAPAPWKTYVCEYEDLVRNWVFFFKQYNARLWTSWEKYGVIHIAIADALTRVGGISTIYQRSFEPNSSEEVTVGADVIFGFSSSGFAIEQGNHSDFFSHVAIGYIGDHRFSLLKEKSRAFREDLMHFGAKHVVAYFDENSTVDERWSFGHSEVCRNYAFWLEKILAVPDLGVIFKPKCPATLRKRLKPITDLLSVAEATGRCRLIMGGQIQSSYPPAFAALAADVAIHESMLSGTAGLEAALAGVPTLLLDEGWMRNPLYRLGSDVVFRDWPSVWEACTEYFQDPQARSHFGDWSSIINEFDPFHDGRAAERMSAYLKELLEGLRRKETPSNVMEMAAERYARRWGKDKIHRGPRTREAHSAKVAFKEIPVK